MAPDRAPDVKGRLRERLRAARRAVSPTEAQQEQRGRALARRVLSDPAVSTACAAGRVVTCFASMPGEPPTDRLLEELAAAGADVLLPRVAPDRGLHWARFTGVASLRPAVLRTREPTGPTVAADPPGLLALRPAVLLIPALAVDRSGSRLGHGGGYYDRLLGQLPPLSEGGPARIAIIGPGEVLDAGEIPGEAHDQRIDRWIAG